MFKKRLGSDPHTGGKMTGGAVGCPDIWELDNGDIAIIGLRKTALRAALPAGVNCGPDEEIVVIPRHTLVSAKKDIQNL